MHLVFRIPLSPHKRVLFRLAPLAALLLLFAACSDDAPQPQQQQVSSETGTPTGTAAPRTMLPMPPVNSSGGASTNAQTFTLLDSRRARVSDYLGQVVVLDFYATWCGPCRVETPHLVEMQRRYGPQGLQVIGLNVGGADDRAKVPAYVEEFRIQYTLGYPDPAMTNLYLSDDDRIPQAFVFDRKGRLVKRFISYDDTMPVELERVVREALAAPATD
ncbi:MAG TPA: TlpA disulfide reductase family protein [Pyrinomonadaceae bacterium]|jgi:thiol-disulfide isomerase/thioredoxin|nr:TlpA disulfide reductase family protein [Pyrinomonadaceae bacterium]